MTEGFDVFVHEVIAAIVTAPWSRVYLVPSDSTTWVGFEMETGAWLLWWCTCWLYSSSGEFAGGSDAGNDSAISRSTRSWSTSA